MQQTNYRIVRERGTFFPYSETTGYYYRIKNVKSKKYWSIYFGTRHEAIKYLKEKGKL